MSLTATTQAKSVITMEESAVFHRSQNKEYGTACGGKGVYLFHPDGSKTLDGSSGAAVSCLGHGHPVVIEAIVDQARKLAFAHSSFFTNDPAEELAHLLTSLSDGAFSKVLFLSSGSEAVESSIKLARHYHFARGESQRVNFIGREYGYHGNTLGALSAGHHPFRRGPFAPLLSPAFHHVAPCFYSHDALASEDESSYVDRLIAEYEAKFQALGPSTVAAVILEPMAGATLGAVPAARGYLSRLRELCDKYGALLIFDEVMCGIGRAGTFHAWQSLGNVKPDLQAVGKGLGGGYQPISAVLISPKIHQALKSSHETKPFISGHTYQDHSVACAAALATQRTIIKQDLLSNVQRMGDLLEQELHKHVPLVKEVRGLGLFRTIEFITPPSGQIASKVTARCLSNGAAVYLCSGGLDAILFAPPYIISEQEVKELVQIFAKSTNEIIDESCG
ncbi:hypothetical protein B0A52_06400 [Exophiala mesophila]|uniref:Uncharacterized protein n=1 Tax=Exophiala mesophila TaxID=212818 RepID=A0A438N205_EXOME|nr:hypothetical protein B0A52_06400 [Exophiala mesophila]